MQRQPMQAWPLLREDVVQEGEDRSQRQWKLALGKAQILGLPLLPLREKAAGWTETPACRLVQAAPTP